MGLLEAPPEPDPEHPVTVGIDWEADGEVCDYRNVLFDVLDPGNNIQYLIDSAEWCLGDENGPGGDWQTDYPVYFYWFYFTDWQTPLTHQKNVWVWWRAKYYWINWQTLEEGPDEWSDPAG